MVVVTLVPWRGGDPAREALWGVVRPALEALGYPLYTGDSEGVWARAAACNAAAEAAGDWDVAVFVDADTIPNPDAIERAVAQVGEGALRPHTHLYLLNRSQTHAALRYGLHKVRLAPGQPEQLGGGCLVVSRAAWDAVGGYSERFIGWGHEDSDLHTRLLAYADFDRIEGVAWHLWHPRPDTRTPERVANQQLMHDVQRRHRAVIEQRSAERGYDVGAIL